MELFLAILLAGGLFLIGAVGTVQSLVALARGYTSSKWPRVTGTIIESRVKDHISADGHVVFHPQVRYLYVVGEREYESVNIRFPTVPAASRRRADTLIAKYPVTSPVSVSYLSQKPAIAVLEPGLTRSACVGAVLGFGFLLSGVLGSYYFLFVWQPH